MLPDPTTLIHPSGASINVGTSATNVVMALIEDPRNNGKTVRVGTHVGIKASLSISLTETKENKPYGTKRVTTRIDLNKIDSEGRPVQAFVSVTFGVPNAEFTTGEINEAKRTLLLHHLHGGVVAGDGNAAFADGDALLTRLLNGEK
jgi:hypothetical protein